MDADILSTLKEEIGKRQFRPVYTLSGDEEYLIDRALSLFRREVVPQDMLAFNFAELSARHASAQDVVQAAKTLPMMSEYRLIIVTDLDAFGAADWDVLASYIRQPNKKSILLLLAVGMDRKTKYYKLLKEETCSLDFAKMKEYALERWAAENFRHRGIRISAGAIKKLIDLAGSDLQTLSGEVEKLILYAGKEKSIEDGHIDELIQGSRQHGIFELTNALARRDRTSALRHLRNMLDSGEPPPYLITMMAWQFRRVLIAKELLARGKTVGEIANRLNIRGGLDEFIRQVKAIPYDAASRVYLRLADVDDRMKSTNLDERLLLENLICSL